jgi:hypothetical protein
VIFGAVDLGLRFNHELGLAAIGTLLLACATFLSLFFLRRSLKQTQAQIEAGQRQLAQTHEEIGLSRTEVEQARRPVVVPATGTQHPTHAGTRELPGGPYVSEPDLLVVPIMNIGLGPALRVESTIEGLDSADGPAHSWSGRQPLAGVTGVGPSGVVGLQLAVHGLGDVPDFKLTITYDDIAGKGWRTVARWIADHGRYEDLSVRPWLCRRADPGMFQPFRPSPAREREYAHLGLGPEAE